MRQIQQFLQSIMVAVLVCAGIFICMNDPGLNVRTTAGWNLAMQGNSVSFGQSGWMIAHQGKTSARSNVADTALSLKKLRSIVRESQE